MPKVLATVAAVAAVVCASAPAECYEPAVNYMLQCMGCHTPDGSGEPGRVPSVRPTLIPFARLPQGRAYLVQVPGAAQSTLSDTELAELLNWMIATLSDAPDRSDFARYTGAEVAGYRKSRLTDVRAARDRLLGMTR